MKKQTIWIVGTLALLMACACQREVRQPEGTEFTPETLIGYMETETKAYLDQLDVKWETGDKISVFSSGHHESYKLNKGANTTVGHFQKGGNEGTAPNLPGRYAFYPFTKETTLSEDGAILYGLPSHQKHVPNLSCQLPMVGYNSNVKDVDVRFFNVCGILSLSLVGNATIKTVVLKGNGGELLHGQTRVTPTSNGCSAQMVSGGSSLTLECDGVTLKEDVPTEFRFVLPPTDFKSGITVLIYDNQGNCMEKSSKKALSVSRSMIEPMQTLSFVPTSRYEGIGAIKDPVLRDHCLKQYDQNRDGSLSWDEAQSVMSLEINNNAITSLEGLRIFPNLQTLVCRASYDYVPGSIMYYLDALGNETIYEKPREFILHGSLKSLGSELLPALTSLQVEGQPLSSVDLHHLPNLQSFQGPCCNMDSIDLSGNSELISLDLYGNNLESLDVSSNTKIERLNANECFLKKIFPLSSLSNLTELALSSNHELKEIGSLPSSLEVLLISDSPISEISISPKMTRLQAGSCALTQVELPPGSQLEELFLSGNQNLSVVDIREGKQLKWVEVSYSKCSILNLSNSPKIERVIANDSWLDYVFLPKGINIQQHDFRLPETAEVIFGEYLRWSDTVYAPPIEKEMDLILYASGTVMDISAPEWVHILGYEGHDIVRVKVRIDNPLAESCEIVATSSGGLQAKAILAPVPSADSQDIDWNNTKFHHKSLSLRFTADWCATCPPLAEELNAAYQAIPDKLVQMNLHHKDIHWAENNSLRTPDTLPLYERFGVSSLPTGILDTRKYYYSKNDILEGVQETESNYPVLTGIAFNSHFVDKDLVLDLSLYVKEAGDYRVYAFLTESHIFTWQTDCRYGEIPDYEHLFLARKAIAPASGELFVTRKNNTVNKFSYTVELDPQWVRDNLDIVVFVEHKYGKLPVLGFGNAESYYTDNAAVGKAGYVLPLSLAGQNGGKNEDITIGGDIDLN